MTKDKLTLDFIINDESINRYGYRILTSGIRTGNFEKNPVCLIQHQNSYLSVGKWMLRKEGSLLLGTCEFDPDDPDAVKIYGKYKNGFMSAVSINVVELAQSTAPEMLLSGQKYPTVTESDLAEISLVTVPGNANAIRLMNREGKEIKLSLINQLNSKGKMNTEQQPTDDAAVRELRQIKEERADELVLSFVNKKVIAPGEVPMYKKLASENYAETKAALKAREESRNDTGRQTEIDALIKLHFDRGAITDPETDFYKKAAAADFEDAKKALELRPGKQSLDAIVDTLGSFESPACADASDRSKWKYLDFYKNDSEGLEKMRLAEPEKYDALLNAHRLELKKTGKYMLDEE
jgi:hypothetical protein